MENLEKPFVVVTFPDEGNAYGVVPVKWLTEDGTCLWPNCVSEQMKNNLVKSQATPREKWIKCKITILKYYSTFESAAQYMDQAEYTSNLESESEFRAKESSEKRKKKTKVICLPGESDHCDSDEETLVKKKKNVFLPLPAPPTARRRTFSLGQDSVTEDDHSGRAVGCRTASPCPKPRQFSPLTIASSSSSYSENDDQMASPSGLRNVPCPLTPTQTRNTCSPALSSIPSNNSDLTQVRANVELLWHAVEQCKESTSRVESKLDRVLSILEMMVEGAGKKPSDNAAAAFAQMPAATLEDFERLESQLKEDENFKQRLVRLLSSLAGPTEKSSAAAIMRKIMNDDVAEVFSLTGKPHPGAPLKKPFIKTHMYRVLFETCMKSHPAFKEIMVRQGVSDWLMQAKFRKGRRERKSNAPDVGEQPN